MKRLKVALDCDVSPRMKTILGELYGSRGFEFLWVPEFALANSADEIWADAFKRFGGSIVISANKRIGLRPHQALAFMDNGFLSFFMGGGWSAMPGPMKMAHLVFWWPIMEERVQQGIEGRCYHVPCDQKEGRLVLTKSALVEMKIPEVVLAQARKARGGQ